MLLIPRPTNHASAKARHACARGRKKTHVAEASLQKYDVRSKTQIFWKRRSRLLRCCSIGATTSTLMLSCESR